MFAVDIQSMFKKKTKLSSYIFLSRTAHLDIIRVFYLWTDAQESCFKKNNNVLALEMDI